MSLSEETLKGAVGNAYFDKIERDTNIKAQISQCASREKLSFTIARKADQLRMEAAKLDELAKNIDILPVSVENVLYPYILNGIYHDSKTGY